MQKLFRTVEILKRNGYQPHYGIESESVLKGQKKYSTSVSISKTNTTFSFNAYAHGWDDPFIAELAKEKLGVATDGFGPAKRMFDVTVKNAQITDKGLADLLEKHKKYGGLEQDIHIYLAQRK